MVPVAQSKSVHLYQGECQIHDFYLHSVDCFPSRIFKTIKTNELQSIKLNVDIEANTCVITSTDLQHFPFHLTSTHFTIF